MIARPARTALWSLVALGLVALAGCAHVDLGHWASPQPGASDQFAGPTATATQFRALATPAVLARVDSASLSGFDRLGFTFSGKRLPSYQVLYNKGGAAQGALFEMRFGARASWANGKPSIPASRQQRGLNYPAVKSISQVRTGEEFVIWNASLAKESEYRVSELTNPPRIVIDFKH